VTQVITHLEVRAQPQQVAAEDAEAEPLAATGTDGRPAGLPRAPQVQRPVLAAAASAPVGGPAAEGWGKVGRNTPCPCGSGRKYKHCHGRLH
jgi:preprotein translocase subunit SecA